MTTTECLRDRIALLLLEAVEVEPGDLDADAITLQIVDVAIAGIGAAACILALLAPVARQAALDEIVTILPDLVGRRRSEIVSAVFDRRVGDA